MLDWHQKGRYKTLDRKGGIRANGAPRGETLGSLLGVHKTTHHVESDRKGRQQSMQTKVGKALLLGDEGGSV